MNDRQHAALTNPLTDTDRDDPARFRYFRERGDRTLLVVILAVDR